MDREESQRDWDVIICGGGMAGLTLARQLRLELPAMRVAIAERTSRPLPASCHKVGESNAELGTAYMERLGLREYLESKHVIKLGLRFFLGSGHLPLEERTEIGPALDPPVRGYQIDRGVFEQDLRAMVEADGVTMWEGTMVRELELGREGRPHELVLDRKGDRSRVRARWVVDATGRSGWLRRKLANKCGTEHVGNAGWFRVEGRVEPAQLVTSSEGPWHEVPMADERWRSTVHLMGTGYWIWIISLANGRTSIGLVTHDAVHGFERVRTLDAVMAFLEEHEPALARRLEGADVLDFRCIKDYSYGASQSYSADRWAMVGEAGVFVDPLYSPGTDFIALSNSFTVELMRADAAGEPLDERVRELDEEYHALVQGSLGVYRKAAPIYGHARAMAAKIYWDNYAYWSYLCPYFLQGMFRRRGEGAAVLASVRARFVALSGYVQSLMSAWARLCPERAQARFQPSPTYPSLAVDAYLDLPKSLSFGEALEAMKTRAALGGQIVAELVYRLLVEYGPEQGRALLDDAGFSRMDLPVDVTRIDAEPTIGLQRRKSLSRVGRDVERALGRPDRHPQWREALQIAIAPAVA